MSMSVNSLDTSSLSTIPTVSSKETLDSSSLKTLAFDIFSEFVAGKSDAKLEKIKEEIKKAAVLPSVEEIVSKYGITTEQAQAVLSEVCMERATEAGGTPEQIVKTATNMYLLAEISDAKAFESVDIEKIMEDVSEQEETDDENILSAQQIADKYDVSVAQAQAVLDRIEKEEENSSYSKIATDVSADPTYSILGGSSGSPVVSIKNSSLPVLSTVSYSA